MRIRMMVTRTVSVLRRQWRRAAARPDLGASTAEYAMTMLAACAFAGVLLAIIRSSPIKVLLLGIIQKAMSLG